MNYKELSEKIKEVFGDKADLEINKDGAGLLIWTNKYGNFSLTCWRREISYSEDDFYGVSVSSKSELDEYIQYIQNGYAYMQKLLEDIIADKIDMNGLWKEYEIIERNRRERALNEVSYSRRTYWQRQTTDDEDRTRIYTRTHKTI